MAAVPYHYYGTLIGSYLGGYSWSVSKEMAKGSITPDLVKFSRSPNILYSVSSKLYALVKGVSLKGRPDYLKYHGYSNEPKKYIKEYSARFTESTSNRDWEEAGASLHSLVDQPVH